MFKDTDDFMVRQRGPIVLVRFTVENLTGILDIQRVQFDIERMIHQGAHHLIVDFKHVKFAGSAALSMLIHLQQVMKKAKGKIVLSHTENIDSLFDVSHTRKLFTIAPDPKAAMDLLE